MMDMEKTEFIRCPICGNKTRDKVREDTYIQFPVNPSKPCLCLTIIACERF